MPQHHIQDTASVSRLLAVTPYPDMQIALERTRENYPAVRLDVYTANLDEAVTLLHSLDTRDYDAILSRGGTADRLRAVSSIPVIDIPISVYDILRAMKLVENYSPDYAIVGFSRITSPAHTIAELLGYDRSIYTLESADEVRPLLERIKRDGVTMMIGDMISYSTAKELGFDAFLVTSGEESLRTAIESAQKISASFRALRLENELLKAAAKGRKTYSLALDADGETRFSLPASPPADLMPQLKSKARTLARGREQLYSIADSELYRIVLEKTVYQGAPLTLCTLTPSRISKSRLAGVHFLDRAQCAYLFEQSFFHIAGAMGEMSAEVQRLATLRQPIFLLGERGTGKEQIARYLYLHSALTEKSFVSLSVKTISERDWNYLLDDDGSPLVESGNTILFQELEAASPELLRRLQNTIRETALYRRARLLFSVTWQTETPLDETLAAFVTSLSGSLLEVPPLRARTDEIPALSSLYLGTLNRTLGKQLVGFDPHAKALLKEHPWAGNYTEFKAVLEELAEISRTSTISGDAVAETLAKSRKLHHPKPSPLAVDADDAGKMLDDYIKDIVLRRLQTVGGSRTKAAQTLGISRTTLWRYLKM